MPEISKAAPDDLEQELCARFERTVPDRVNSDRHLVWRGRDLTTDCLVQIGSIPFLLRIQEGRILELRKRLAPLSSWAFAVRGSARGWAALWQDPPPPGWHDIFALVKRGEMKIEGNIHAFMANLQYFKDIISLAREGGGR